MNTRDMRGNEINVGDTVIKVREGGSVALLEFREVTRIRNGIIYIDKKGGGDVPVVYPDRLLIWSNMYDEQEYHGGYNDGYEQAKEEHRGALYNCLKSIRDDLNDVVEELAGGN